jgi:hypothetical protein
VPRDSPGASVNRRGWMALLDARGRVGPSFLSYLDIPSRF